MAIKHSLFAASFLAIFLSANTFAQTRENSNMVVGTFERTFEVTYPNGQTDVFKFEWHAHVTARMTEHGESSSWRHPTDTRRCDFSVGSYIERTGYFITGSGQELPWEEATRRYQVGTRAYATNDPLQQLFGEHSPCNDYVGRFNEQKRQARERVLGDLEFLQTSPVVPESISEFENMVNANLTPMPE